MFIVQRNGGNRNHKWKTILETENQKQAEVNYTATFKAMRQGGVRIITETGEVIRQVTAPRLRRIW